MSKSEQTEATRELIVYSCQCVEHGPELQVFNEDDIQAAGSIYGVEMGLQRDSYWFVRLGTIEGRKRDVGWSYTEEALAALPVTDLGAWQLGRRNPSFKRGELERQIFQSLFQSLSAFLKSWNHEEEELISAYTPKEIRISPNRISSIASALTSIRRAQDVVEMTVLKYWCDPESEITWPTVDQILGEFPPTVPVQFRWGTGDRVVATDILTISSC